MSSNTWCVQITSHKDCATPWYSNSDIEWEITLCFFLLHDTKFPPTKTQRLLVDNTMYPNNYAPVSERSMHMHNLWSVYPYLHMNSDTNTYTNGRVGQSYYSWNPNYCSLFISGWFAMYTFHAYGIMYQR